MDRSYFFTLSVDGSIMADDEEDAKRRILMEFNTLPGWNVYIDDIEVEDDDE